MNEDYATTRAKQVARREIEREMKKLEEEERARKMMKEEEKRKKRMEETQSDIHNFKMLNQPGKEPAASAKVKVPISRNGFSFRQSQLQFLTSEDGDNYLKELHDRVDQEKTTSASTSIQSTWRRYVWFNIH